MPHDVFHRPVLCPRDGSEGQSYPARRAGERANPHPQVESDENEEIASEVTVTLAGKEAAFAGNWGCHPGTCRGVGTYPCRTKVEEGSDVRKVTVILVVGFCLNIFCRSDGMRGEGSGSSGGIAEVSRSAF